MAYQAGQAFIQTVPSLKGFVRRVRSELKTQFGANPIDVPVKPDADWGPLKREAAKEGADAGGAFAKTFRARVDAALKAIPDIKVGADTSEADRELAGLRTRLQALRDARIGVDVDAGQAQAEIAAISSQLRRISGEDARIDVQANTAAASAELHKIFGQAERLDRKDVEVNVRVDRDRSARMNMAAVGRSMNGLILTGGLLAPTFLPALGAITVAVGALGSAFVAAGAGAGALIAVAAPAIGAVSEALKAQEQAAKDAATSTVANAQKQIQAASAAASAARAVADARRNADRTAIDSARRVADARAALDAAEVEGARKVAEAQEALAEAREDGARRIADAESGLADARQRASDLVIDAGRRMADSERALVEAQREQQRAQEDLTRAREDATRALKDMREQASDLLLDEEAAAIRLIEARQYLAEVQGNEESTALDLRKAKLAVAQAEDRVSDVKRAQQRTTEDLTEAERKGVKGSDIMVAARDRLRKANQSQAEALRDHRQAQADYTRAQADAAGIISDAERKVADARRATAEAVEDAEQRIRDARRTTAETLAGAEQSLADARTRAARANSDAARSVSDALRAQAQQAELARLETVEGTAAQRNLAVAMGALTPMQKQLMQGWISLREAFTGWAAALEPAVLPLFIGGMQLLERMLPLLTPIVESAAAGFGRLLDAAGKALEAPFWREFFDFLARSAGPSAEAFGRIFGNLAGLFAGLMIAFEPMATTFMGWLVRLTERWAEWAKNLDQNDGFKRFLQFVSDHAPQLGQFFSALWGALVNIGRALVPLAGPMLTALTAVLNFVANLPPPVLAGLATGFVAIGLALALMNGVIAALAANPIILVIAALAGLAVGFYVAYQRSEKFRDVLDGVFRAVGKVVKWLWENVWKPTWDALVELYETSLKPVLKELGRLFVEVIGPAILWLMKNVLGPFYKLVTWIFVKVIAPMLGWFLRNVVRPTITIIIELFKGWARIATWLWKNILKPIFRFIGEGFQGLGRFFKRVWDDWLFPVVDLFIKNAEWLGRGFEDLFRDIKKWWNNIADIIRVVWNRHIKPYIEAFGTIWGAKVQPKIDAFVGTFSRAWDSAVSAVKDAIDWLIKNVLNGGIIKGFNIVAKFFGAKQMEDVPLINAPPKIKKNKYQTTRGGKRAMEGLNFATGGIIPGSVRTKYDSVTINARPGESVMVPQFTDQVGGERGVHHLNRMAERGQLRALLGEHAEGFAGGGVVSYKGHSFTEEMVRRIKNAERLAGVAFSIFQGGFRPYTSYSKGTHGKDAIDNGPVNSTVVAAMRKSGIVAWDRTGKGNWAPHIHGIPVPGGGVQLSPSARGQYESYLKGGDGLGGTDTGPTVTGTGARGGIGIPKKILDIFTAPLKWLKNLVSKALGSKFGNSRLAQVALGIPRKISTAVKDYFADKFSGGDPGTSGFRTIGKTAGAAQSYAASQLGKHGWTTAQMPALTELWNRESRWNYLAKNPSSGAYGIPQSLPGHKMANPPGGKDWRTNPATQVNWGLDYIKDRYGSPGSALSFHDRNNWYDNGGFLPPLNGTGKPEPVLTDAQWNAIVTNAKRGMDMPEIHVYVGDEEITEIVRVELLEHDRTVKRLVGQMGGGLGS